MLKALQEVSEMWNVAEVMYGSVYRSVVCA